MHIFKSFYFYILIILFISSLYFLRNYLTPANQLPYEVLTNEENIEIREYPYFLVAEIKTKEKRSKSLKWSVKILLDYISGNNSQKEAIPMTTPILQQKINNEWIVSFILPKNYTLNNIPTPNNKNIYFREISPAKYIAILFSGKADNKNITENNRLLKKYCNEYNINIINASKLLAFYSPPWMIPMLKRNEILYKISY